MAGEPHTALAGAQAVLTIDLAALADNWKTLAARVAPARCAAVVKADAYGIGLEPAVVALARAGCRVFFVAHPGEGARARAALGARRGCAIRVLNGLPPQADIAGEYVAHGLRPVLGSLAELRAWAACAPARKIPVTLHVDTGMNRLGLASCDIDAFMAIARDARVGVDLVMSHFVSSEDRGDPLNARQIAAFDKARARLPGVAASLSNSSGLFLPKKPFYDLARPGYALYGGNPVAPAKNPMRPVATLRAPIIQLREIAAGETVGYNAQWTARRPTRLATIGVGYADGLPRNLMATDARPGGEAMVAGVRCPFAGRVSMDLIVIDVTDAPRDRVAPGVMVELLGEHITVDDMGVRAGTIGYEILTGLGRRYRRVYTGGAAPETFSA